MSFDSDQGVYEQAVFGGTSDAGRASDSSDSDDVGGAGAAATAKSPLTAPPRNPNADIHTRYGRLQKMYQRVQKMDRRGSR